VRWGLDKVFGGVERTGYFFPVDPGVVFESSGAEGLRWPRLFSGVLEVTAVLPGPAVPGLSPSGPEGVAAAFLSDCAVFFASDCWCAAGC